MMKRICVVTGTRAEYGLLKPVLEKIIKSGMELRLIATGAHLCPEFGETINEIIMDGFSIDDRLECVLSSSTPVGMTKSTAIALLSFADYFNKRRPDMLLILGDRYEIFACATAAAIANIPIAHMYGGDTTEGAVDEFFRHAITKMSYLHFVSNENSKRRVIQLGESPERVFNVGSTGIENILKMELLSKEQLEKALNFNLGLQHAMITFHPVTMEYGNAKKQINELFKAIEYFPDLKYVFTKANADAEGRIINALIDKYVAENKNCVAFESLGSLRYLSALKYAKVVIGNSSSGICEAPSFHIPTINIGDRQKGRLKANSIIDCEPSEQSIKKAIEQALGDNSYIYNKNINNPYQGNNPSGKIMDIITETLQNKVEIKKKFYDLR